MANNLGETSFLFSDVIANHAVMGLAVLDQKMEKLKNLSMAQTYFLKTFEFSKRATVLAQQYQIELAESFEAKSFDMKKFNKAHENLFRVF